MKDLGTFLAEKWVYKIFDISWVSDRVILIKALVQGIIVSAMSVYDQHCGFHSSSKNYFYDSLISGTSKFREKESVVKTGDFNGNIGGSAEDYEVQHES